MSVYNSYLPSVGGLFSRYSRSLGSFRIAVYNVVSPGKLVKFGGTSSCPARIKPFTKQKKLISA